MGQGMVSNSPRRIFNDWEDNGLPAGSHVIGKVTSGSPQMFFGRVGPLAAIINATVYFDTSAYSALDRAGSGTGAYGAIRFRNAARYASGGGVVRGATFIDKGEASPNLDMILFTRPVGTSHGLDNAAFLLADADASKVLGTISTGTKSAAFNPTPNWVVTGQTCVQFCPVYLPFVCGTGRDLYGEIICQGAWDADAADDLKIRLLVEQN